MARILTTVTLPWLEEQSSLPAFRSYFLKLDGPMRPHDNGPPPALLAVEGLMDNRRPFANWSGSHCDGAPPETNGGSIGCPKSGEFDADGAGSGSSPSARTLDRLDRKALFERGSLSR
jgi:hypothetical protein